MDGLFVDTETLHLEAFQKVCRDVGVEVSFRELCTWVGKGQHRLSAWIQEVSPQNPRVEDLLEAQRQEFFRGLEKTRPGAQPGAEDLLEVAMKEGLRVGLVSNSDRELVTRTMGEVLPRMGRDPDPSKTFEVVVTRDDVANPKPAPDPYLLAAETLGLLPGECLAFEDSPSGARAASAAGCPLFVVPCPYLTDPKEATELALDWSQSLEAVVPRRTWASIELLSAGRKIPK